MRTELYQWMKSLAFFHVLTTALLHILPDKRYEQYIRLFMGLLLVLLICTPIFAVVGKSEELLSGFSNNYGREEQVRMKTEAEGIRETFLKGAYEQELKDQVQGILRKEGVFSAKTEVDMEKELQLTITLYGTVTEKQREAVKMSSKESADSGKDSIRSWLLRMGWKEWGVFLLLGILLLVAGLPVTRKNSKTAEDQNAEKTRLESRLEELLSNVEGVGEVEVIIMTGDEGNTENFSISIKNEVTGVLVAAQGAGSAVTVQNIQQAIMALFQIDANKIRIMKMK